MKKTYTFIFFTVLTKNKLTVTSVNTKKTPLKLIFNKCSNALRQLKLSPSDEVVNKILKYADY